MYRLFCLILLNLMLLTIAIGFSYGFYFGSGDISRSSLIMITLICIYAGAFITGATYNDMGKNES